MRYAPGFRSPQLFNFADLLPQIPFVFNAGLQRNDILASNFFGFDYAFGDQLFELNVRTPQQGDETWPLPKVNATRCKVRVHRIHTSGLNLITQELNTFTRVYINLLVI